MINKTKMTIGNIPTIIWGEESEKIYIFVHGKMSQKEEAEQFAQIAEEKGYQTISFDLPEHGERKGRGERCDIFHGIEELNQVADFVFAKWKSAALFGCSLGAFFCLHAYQDRKFERALFQSPIVDMEYLIQKMFLWFQVTEQELEGQGEIETPIDILSWKYYCYVKEHPIINWKIPTGVLYGGKDNLQSREVIESFCKCFFCQLTIAGNSEHAFMDAKDGEIVIQWMRRSLE